MGTHPTMRYVCYLTTAVALAISRYAYIPPLRSTYPTRLSLVLGVAPKTFLPWTAYSPYTGLEDSTRVQ
eukprot:1132253-Pyramimonas_sp.AAC.1